MPDPAAPFSASTLLLRARQIEIDDLQHLARRAALADLIGQLIQALQRERGASSIFLASSGLRFARARGAIVDEVRVVEGQVRVAFAAHVDPGEGANAATLSLMAWALWGLDTLGALRTQIERQALSAHDAVAAFSHLIAGLIELVFQLADGAALPGISRLLVSFVHLVQAQEAAGQERAVGALLFAGGQCGEEHQQRVLHLIDAQERSLAVFADFAEPALRGLWEQQQVRPEVARLERLRRTLFTARAGAVLDSNLSDLWFEVCSQRIDQLWQLQTALMARMKADCADRIETARKDLQDSRGLLRHLRDHPPARTHAVDRFFEAAALRGGMAGSEPSSVLPMLAGGGVAAASLVELLRAQSARMAGMAAELETARRTLHERKVIERAKGMLMARLGLNEAAAFRMLQKTSMDQNRRLLDVAEATLSLPDFTVASGASAPASPASPATPMSAPASADPADARAD